MFFNKMYLRKLCVKKIVLRKFLILLFGLFIFTESPMEILGNSKDVEATVFEFNYPYTENSTVNDIYENDTENLEVEIVHITQENIPVNIYKFAEIDTTSITQSDLEYFAKMVHNEFGNGGYSGTRAVATVLVNRIYDGRMGTSIKSAIEWPNQFDTYKMGRLNTDYVCSECLEAVKDVIYNDYRSFPAFVLYFQSISEGYFKDQKTFIDIPEEKGNSVMFFSYKDIDKQNYLLEK